jgi:hypothetical protein
VSVDGTKSFSSSPTNEMVRSQSYRFTSDKALSGFDAAKSDKLVVTLSYEGTHSITSIKEVTYGGVRMNLAVESEISKQIKTAIYYLDSPDASGDLVIKLNGNPNGIGGSVVALSGTKLGGLL